MGWFEFWGLLPLVIMNVMLTYCVTKFYFYKDLPAPDIGVGDYAIGKNGLIGRVEKITVSIGNNDFPGKFNIKEITYTLKVENKEDISTVRIQEEYIAAKLSEKEYHKMMAAISLGATADSLLIMAGGKK